MSVRIGSLFSGYGGLDLAALQLFPGASVAWHCEWEAAPSAILDHHWPGVLNLHDVTTVDWDAVEPVDILTGGYPCQPFSAAGRRKGTTDERHLWPYVREAIRRVRPRYTLLENVAGHRSLGFDRVLGDMAEDGMHVRWTSVRASDVGACHRRERLFILVTDSPAHTGGDGLVRCPQRHSIPEEPRLATPCGDDVDGRHLVHQRAYRSTHGDVTTLLPTPTATPYGSNQSPSAGAAVRPSLDGLVRMLPTPTSRDHKGAANRPGRTRDGRPRTAGDDLLPDAASKTADGVWGPYEAAVTRQASVSRPAPEPTERGREGNPRLAAAFAEWMMFLPAGHVTDPAIGLSRNDQLKAIGNGVCPPQAVAAYRSLLQMQAVAA